jgi:hypothetical protein
MTGEEFIGILSKKGYSYEIEGDRIIVTHGDAFFLNSPKSIPSGVIFKNDGIVDLSSLRSISPDVEFNNSGNVYLGFLIGRWFDEWDGNIEGIDSKRLLNSMISKGIFER